MRTGRLGVALRSLDGNRDMQRLVDGFVVTEMGSNEREVQGGELHRKKIL
jgi:hypothetical protein